MTTTTRTEITDELRLTMLKHLAGGKDLDTVATIVRIPRPLVLDVVSKHGYPNSLDKGIELLTIETPVGAASTPAPTGPGSTPRPATTSPSSVTHPDARPVGAPDEIRVLLNTGKNHPSKRIQGAANRVLDAIGRLRDLLAEDAEKNAAKRAEEAEKVAIRAEVKRLEAQLADAKAKLRGGSKPVTTTIDVPPGVSSEQLANVVDPKKRTVTKQDYTCPDCDTKLHTTDGGYRLHRMKAPTTPGTAPTGQNPCDPCRRAEARYEQARVLDQLSGRPRMVPGTGTRRRVQALFALGHSFARIAEGLDMTGSAAWTFAHRDTWVRATTAAKVATLYEAWSMTLPPATTGKDRKAAAYARTVATKHGWLPPLAWDDIDHDAAAASGGQEDLEVDWVTVERILAGDLVPATTAERRQVVARWPATRVADRLTRQAKKARTELDRLNRDRDAAVVRRDYLAQHPDLQSTSTTKSTTRNQSGDTA